MPHESHLETGTPWVELSTTEDDWKAADPALLGTMLAQLRSTDAVNGSHRGHHQFLAKALIHVSGGVIDPTAP